MKIPQKLEEVLESNLRFLRFGDEHPERVLFGQISKEGYISPTYIFGPADAESFMHLNINMSANTKHKVKEATSYTPGVIDFYLENGDCYQLHMKQATMPNDIDYTPVSWDDLMIASR